MPAIDRDEFLRWMKLLQEGQAGISARLDKMNGTVGEHTTKIAVLDTLVAERTDVGARITAGIAGVLSVLGAVWHYFKN